jgi:hypothetical protein
LTPEQLLSALNLPPAAVVGQRVPKKLLLENGAPTAADKRLINEGVEELRWTAVLKPSTCGVPEFRDAVREYLEIAVLHVRLRSTTKVVRLIELIHRAVPYPVLLIEEDADGRRLSLAHKRLALNEAAKVVLDGEPESVELASANGEIAAGFLQALSISRQPKGTLYALYQGWLDTALALKAATITGQFTIHDAASRVELRRRALQRVAELQDRIAVLRREAAKASQMARQVELNLQLRKLEGELVQEEGGL